MNLRGTAVCVDGVLDVDWDIAPVEDAHFLKYDSTLDLSEEKLKDHLASHCFMNADSDIRKKIHPGDFLVGNRGVGWGHGHDHAILALKAVGIAVIICETTTMTFKRNCINHGLPIVEIPNVFYRISNGDHLELNLGESFIQNFSTHEQLKFDPYPEFMIETLKHGGIYPQLAKELSRE